MESVMDINIEQVFALNSKNTFFDAWWFLNEHEAFLHPEHKCEYDSFFKSYCLDVDVQRVNPITRRIEPDAHLNTLTEVWLECGAAFIDEDGSVQTSHDYRLDCGAETFEEAIIKLANLVNHYYGGVE